MASVFAGRPGMVSRRRRLLQHRARQPRAGRRCCGLTIYQLGDGFRPARVIMAPRATLGWAAAGDLRDTETHELKPDGIRVHALRTAPASRSPKPSTTSAWPSCFEPEAFGYRMLRRQMPGIAGSKGVDTSEEPVLKLAFPAAAVIMVLVAGSAPRCVRLPSTIQTSAPMAMGFAVGFSYFMLVGFARALGQSGALPRSWRPGQPTGSSCCWAATSCSAPELARLRTLLGKVAGQQLVDRGRSRRTGDHWRTASSSFVPTAGSPMRSVPGARSGRACVPRACARSCSERHRSIAASIVDGTDTRLAHLV